MAEITRAQARFAAEVLQAVTETIHDLGEVSEGALYAPLMGHIDLPAFESMITLIVRSGLVSRRNHMLRWIGPRKEAS